MNEWCFDLNAYDKEKAFEEMSIFFNKNCPHNRLLNQILDCEFLEMTIWEFTV